MVDDGLEVRLQVQPLGQAVGGHQDRAAGLVAGQLPDRGFPVLGWQRPGDRGDRARPIGCDLSLPREQLTLQRAGHGYRNYS
jgi:hypothetical protein